MTIIYNELKVTMPNGSPIDLELLLKYNELKIITYNDPKITIE